MINIKYILLYYYIIFNIVIKDVCSITDDTQGFIHENIFYSYDKCIKPLLYATLIEVSCCFRLSNINIDFICYCLWLL